RTSLDRRSPRNSGSDSRCRAGAPKAIQLVGADREPESVAAKPLENALEVRERPRAVGNMGAIMVDENPRHAIELGGRYVPSFGDQGGLDYAARSAADHAPRVIVGDRRQALAGPDEIKRRNQIGRGIDQRAVEIKDDGAHDSVLIPVFALGESKTRFAALGSPP